MSIKDWLEKLCSKKHDTAELYSAYFQELLIHKSHLHPPALLPPISHAPTLHDPRDNVNVEG
jgi:hypothetical protein